MYLSLIMNKINKKCVLKYNKKISITHNVLSKINKCYITYLVRVKACFKKTFKVLSSALSYF